MLLQIQFDFVNTLMSGNYLEKKIKKAVTFTTNFI